MASLPRITRRRAHRADAISIGDRFGRLAVIGSIILVPRSTDGKYRMVPCRCDCGTEKTILSDNLLSGATRSCGCIHREAASKNLLTHGQAAATCRTRLYGIWGGVKTRCLNPRSSTYDRYGGRGISICEEWRTSFEAFRDWAMATGYADDLEIDRINNDGDYSPSNCRWVTKAENIKNKSNTRYITAFGETKPLSDWQRDSRCTVSRRGLAQRLKLGWAPEDAISKPVAVREHERRAA